MHADLLSWDELIFATELKTEEYVRDLFEAKSDARKERTEVRPPVRSAKKSTYVAVDDVQVYVESLKLAGGRVVSAPGEIPGYGKMCEVVDPSGTRVRVIDRHEQLDFRH